MCGSGMCVCLCVRGVVVVGVGVHAYKVQAHVLCLVSRFASAHHGECIRNCYTYTHI